MASSPRLNVLAIINCENTEEVGMTKIDFEKFAEDNHIPFFFANTVNSNEWRDWFSNQKIDLVVALLWLTTIDTQIIKSVSIGFINLHGGDLPRYRGNACQSWAILNNEQHIGITAHFMKGGELDSGPIIRQIKIPITGNTLVGELITEVYQRGKALVMESIEEIIDGRHFLKEQNHSLSLECFPRLPRDGEIDWNDSSYEIDKLVRAAGEPYPGAYSWFTYAKDPWIPLKLTILESEVLEYNQEFLAMPGQVIKYPDINSRSVVCGDLKLLLLKEIRLNSKKVRASQVFLSRRQRLGLDYSSMIFNLEMRLRRLETGGKN